MKVGDKKILPSIFAEIRPNKRSENLVHPIYLISYLVVSWPVLTACRAYILAFGFWSKDYVCGTQLPAAAPGRPFPALGCTGARPGEDNVRRACSNDCGVQLCCTSSYPACLDKKDA